MSKKNKTTKTFRVVWEIDVDARNAKEAATIASDMLANPDIETTFWTYKVKPWSENGPDLEEKWKNINLEIDR